MSTATPLPTTESWSIEDLRSHLQYAVDLEFWTIPFYMTAMFSIKDRSASAFQYIQSVVYQEMLHAQLAANVANAYGTHVTVSQPYYVGQNIPHLDFELDTPDPRHQYSPYSAELGPLDRKRINAFCLIEYPEWRTHARPRLSPACQQYGSIGQFYHTVALAAERLAEHIEPRNQVDHFGRYYANAPGFTVTGRGREAWPQVKALIDCIVAQGEGGSSRLDEIPEAYQNTADDSWMIDAHYEKFVAIRGADSLPEVYRGIDSPPPGSQGAQMQAITVETFAKFRASLELLFNGGHPEAFVTDMVTLGGNMLNCWKHGAIPRFAPHPHPEAHLAANSTGRCFPVQSSPHCARVLQHA